MFRLTILDIFLFNEPNYLNMCRNALKGFKCNKFHCRLQFTEFKVKFEVLLQFYSQFVQITESLHQESLSTSAVLYYCQSKILRPYSRLLCVMGLRPSPIENTDRCCILLCCGYVHLVLVLVLMCVGYVLQYMSCFRYNNIPPSKYTCNNTTHIHTVAKQSLCALHECIQGRRVTTLLILSFNSRWT